MDKLTLQFTPQQLDYIFTALAQRPWAEVNQLLVDIQAQIAQQQQPLTGQQLPNGEMQHAP